jgi:LPXTG-motif cell wall-anchored protein
MDLAHHLIPWSLINELVVGLLLLAAGVVLIRKRK